MQTRDLAVPGERDVGMVAAPDGDGRARRGVELNDPLNAGAVAQDEERFPDALGTQARLHLTSGAGSRRASVVAVRSARMVHHLVASVEPPPAVPTRLSAVSPGSCVQP